ncbi:hypothetical protein RN001_001944 [Aquatica leii]|uniref:Uncharacterized protein n=1 Tax=Aquatica leii TaxID=1421715 RepID=A0AAN7SR27_9COLE|nr:hypothetical protein RN001_001944 [Aquatica leii]
MAQLPVKSGFVILTNFCCVCKISSNRPHHIFPKTRRSKNNNSELLLQQGRLLEAQIELDMPVTAVGSSIEDSFEPRTPALLRRERYHSNTVLDFSTPRRSSWRYIRVTCKLNEKLKQVHTLQNNILRLRKKIKSLSQLISHLHSKCLLSKEAERIIQTVAIGNLNDIL